MDPGSPVLTIGPINCRLLDLKTLDSELSDEELDRMKMVTDKFQRGWLSSRAIDGYLFSLREKYPKMAVLPWESACHLKAGSSLDKVDLWQGQNITDVDYIVGPWNATGHHWTIFVVDMRQKKVLYMDPDYDNHHKMLKEKDFKKGLEDLREYLPYIVPHYQRDFHLKIDLPEHKLQEDNMSCGVYCCYYVERLLTGKSLQDPFDPCEMRHKMWVTLRDDCLQRFTNREVQLDVCPICSVADTRSQTSCPRCYQKYHLHCVNPRYERGKPFTRCPSLQSGKNQIQNS